MFRFMPMKSASVALVLVVLTPIVQSQANLTLRTAPLSVGMKGEIVAIVSAGDQSDPAEQKRAAFDTYVSFLPLRSGAPPAILIEPSDEASESWCAPNGNGNCPFWLFQQSNGHAVLLLENSGLDISMAKTSHNGMRDLVETEREGHTPVDVFTTELHFDGKAYQPAICSESISGGDADDTEVEVPPHPCNTRGQRIVKH